MTNTHGGRRDNRKKEGKVDRRGGRRVPGPGKKLGRPKTMRYIVQGQNQTSGYKYDIKDGFKTIDAARDYRDQLQRGEATMPGGHAFPARDVLMIACYEQRSYESTFVE